MDCLGFTGLEIRFIQLVGDGIRSGERLLNLVGLFQEVLHFEVNVLRGCKLGVRINSDGVGHTDLDLIDVNLAVLFLQLLVCLLHGIYCGHCISKVLSRKSSRLHVERLLDQLRKLGLVHAFLLQRPHGALLYGILPNHMDELGGRAMKTRRPKPSRARCEA